MGKPVGVRFGERGRISVVQGGNGEEKEKEGGRGSSVI